MAARKDPGPVTLRERRAGSLHVALGGDPAAPPVVLLHGLGASWRVWKPLLGELAQGFRVIAVDLPGFGRSAAFEDGAYCLTKVGERIDDALNELGVGNHALVGHSLGGGIAVSYAVDRPGRVASLALLAPSGFFRYPGIVRAAWNVDIFHRVGKQGTRFAAPVVVGSDLLRRAVFSQLFHDLTKVSVEDLNELVEESLLGDASRTAGAAVLNAHLIERVDALTMPTLLAWGRNDRIVRARYAETLAEAIPGCERLLLLERAGHLLMWDRAEVLAPELRAFVAASVIGARGDGAKVRRAARRGARGAREGGSSGGRTRAS